MKSKGVATESFYYFLILFVGFAILVALILNQVWEYRSQLHLEHKNALASAKSDTEYVSVSMNKLMTITGTGGAHLDEYVEALNSEGSMQVRIVHSRYIDIQYGVDKDEQPETAHELMAFKDGKPKSWETEEFFANVIPMNVDEWCQECHFTLEDDEKPLPIGFTLGLVEVKIPTTQFKEVKNLLQLHTYRAVAMESLIVLLFGLGIFLSGTGLRKMARQNRLILEKALEGFLMLDLKGIVLNCNHTFAAMLGYSPEELVGTDVRDICGKRDNGEIKMPLSAKEIGSQFREIDVYRARDGRVLDVETSVTIIASGKDRIIYGFIRDITERKQSQEELVRAKENLENKNREMQKDLNIAHEMQLSIVPQKESMKFFSQGFSLGISSVFKPCQKLGGDYWDFVDINKEKIGIIIIDFAGHGIVPCFNAFRIKEFIYTFSEMLDAVINSLKEFTAGAELDDDTTLVAIEQLGE